MTRVLQLREDHRGWLCELFRADELPTSDMPAMGYVSLTLPGVTRGPHEHREQTDQFAFIGPSNFRLYLWDNRSASPTFRRREELECGEARPLAVIVPPGVVHAYRNIGKVGGLVYNCPNRLYAGRGRTEVVDEIRHEADPGTPFRIED